MSISKEKKLNPVKTSFAQQRVKEVGMCLGCELSLQIAKKRLAEVKQDVQVGSKSGLIFMF